MAITKEQYENLKALTVGILDERGREVVSPMPLFIDIDGKKPPTLEERVSRILHRALAIQRVTQEGFETIDEANDFDVDEDINDHTNLSGFELMTDEVPSSFKPQQEQEEVKVESGNNSQSSEDDLPVDKASPG